MNFEGIAIGAGAFVIIGALHPVVIKVEYYFGCRAWPVFLIPGVLCVGFSLFGNGSVVSSLLSVLGFSLLWSIRELFQQKKRVENGWFPRNPRRYAGQDETHQ